ncbi:hemagglutinin repeat-containing protein [Cupriavidus sp.]|uniref:hemagglutinin repeat-containing protein n=2 Tax=Cupriavidus sp. TaxID=1873897 RepID=UPI0025BE4FD7|nr:hemagglutinin repeat-containing protein [Cupriavidus sp.]
MMMAVAETTSGHASGNAAGTRGGTPRPLAEVGWLGVPAIKLAVWACMGLPMVAGAQIVADPNSGANRPTVIATPNGLPQVNITRPSGAGVSTNHYTQFDVNKAGAILNNSPVIANTQQAGYINGNPNLLPGGSARIIVNQVNSMSPSQLRGYLEVAGPRAEVIVANPNGILVDGAGFINTSRATLTTGLPVYGGSGSLDAFRVTGGQIQIEGAGLNAAGVDQVDLIARAVKANAAVYANRLNVVAGANQVDYNSLGATAIAGTGAAPAAGIDVSQLGGMYANKILLASTEQGVGVSLRGVMAAQAGDMTLTSQGKLVLAGQTNAAGNIAVAARDGIDNSGTTYATGSVGIRTEATLNNSGTLAAQQSLGVNAQNVASGGTLAAGLNPDGVPVRGADLTVNASGAVSATGRNLASGNAAIHGDSVSLAGSQTATNGNLTVSASAGGLDLTGATTTAGADLAVNVRGVLINDRGQMSSGAATTLTAGSLSNRGGQIEGDTLAIRTSGDLGNQGGSLKQLGQGDATITAGGRFDNTGGAVAANGQNLTIDAASLVNDGGRLSHAGAGTLSVTSQDRIGNEGGVIQTNGDLKAQATTLDNGGGAMSAQGKLTAIASGNLSNRAGSVYGNTGLMLASGATVDNSGGSAQTTGDLAISATGAVLNHDGMLAANGVHGAATVSATSIDNTRGSLVNAGDGATTITASNALTNTAGKLGGNGDVTVAAQTLANNTNGTTGGQVVAGGALDLKVRSQLDNRGGMLYGQRLTFDQAGATLDNAAGQVLGGADVKLAVASLSNLAGAVKANQDVAVSGAMSGSGTMIAGRDLTLNAVGDYTNDASNQLQANGNLQVTATGTLANTGTLATAGALTVSGANVVNGAGADINSSNTSVKAVDKVSNAGRIEGDTVQVSGPSVVNTGTVIGNNVQVQGTDIVNNGSTALMAAVRNLNLYAGNSVQNLDGATLYSAGNLQIARDGTRDTSSGLLANQTNALINRSATIEADGDIDIAANQVSNTRTSIVTTAGTPVQTAVKTLALWQGGLPGTELNYHGSITFPDWSWATGSAPISTPQTNALRTPLTVTVDKSTVTNLNPVNQTLSFTQSPIEEYTSIFQGTNCDIDTSICSRPIATRPTQYYQSITDNGSTYSITFWPDWDPNIHIRPDEVRQANFGTDFNEISRTTVTYTATDQLVSATEAAKIQASGNIRINSNGGNILNQSSTMAAGGNLVRAASNGSIQDVGTVLQQTVTTQDTSTFYWHQRTGNSQETQVVAYPSAPQAPTTTAALPAVATANQAVQTTAQDVTVAAVNAVGAAVTGSSVSGGGASGTRLGRASGTVGIPNLKLPTNGLYQFRTAPGDTYLVATDPRFTQYGSFISSDYMLGALGLDPQKTQKRLGDGFYEEKLVRDQITQLTGKTFLAGYTDQLEEYKALMNNGVTYAKTFDLTPGVGLTDEQMRQLTTDMVWMVSQDVTLPDGTTQSVLVPKVYLAQGNGVDLNATGALVAGNTVAINATGNVENSGSIVGDIATQVLGGNIVNRGSIGGAGTTVVQATQDVRNLGGRIGGQDVVVAAGRDIVNESQTITNTTTLANGNSASATGIGAVASISGTNNVALLAGRDIDMAGGTVDAGSNALLAAGRDIHLGTVATGTTQDATAHDGQDYLRDRTVVNVGSTVQAGQGVTAVAGRDMTLTNANVQSGDSTTLVAGQNVAIVNATDTHTHSAGAQSNRDQSSFTQSSYDETVRGTTVQAGANVRVGAGQADIAADVLAANGITAEKGTGGTLGVVGSTLSAGSGAAGGNVTLVAKDDIVIAEAREVHDESHEARSRRSGFLSRKSSYDAVSTHEDIGVGSLVSGDTVTAVAGNDLLIRQSAVTATDAVNLTATRGDVLITAGENTRESTEAHERSASGVSFSAGKGGIGMSAASSNAKSNSHTVAVTQSDARSTVGATNGNVTIVAGKDVAIAGSDLIAGRVGDSKDAGNIAIQAENITVTTGIDSVVQDSSRSSRSTNFGVHLVGTPLDTIRNLQANNQSDSTVTRVKQNLGEIGHSVGSAPQVAITFGKNSSNATSHVESLTNSGSTLTGAGNITLRATGNGQSDAAGKSVDGDILLHGSAISAGGKATLDAQRNVNIEASTDTYSESTSSNSSGWKISTAVATLGDIGRNLNGSANNSGVSTLPFGTQKSSASGDLSVSAQNASTVTGDSVSIVSRTGDVRIAGSGVAAENDIAIAAKQGRVDILSGQDARSQRSDSSSRVIGDLGGDGYTGMSGIRTESHHLDESGTSENTIRSQVVSQSGSVSISAKDDLTARGADIAAGQDVTLIGKNVLLDPGTDDSARNQVDKSSQYGVTLALSGYSVTAAKAAEAAARAVEDGKDGRVAGLYAAQAGLALVNGGVIGKDVLTSAGQQTPQVIKVTVSVGGGSQQSESHSTASNQQGTTVKAGNAVTVVARGSGEKDADGFATDGDITGRGVQISGKTVDLVAARDVTLESAQDRASNDSRSSGNNFGVGVGFALGGAQNGFTLELSAAQNKAKANGESVTNENSYVSATDKLTVTSGRDTNLKGAQLVADRIEGSVGRDLNIESRQDTDVYHSKESSSGMQASICVPPFCYGTTVNASGTTASGKTDSTYASVREQSGIYAGQGGFDVNVKGNTDLKGGILASTADSSKNSLTTGTLTTSDIENKAEYSSSSSQYAASFSAGKSVPDGQDAMGNAVKQGAYLADNLNLAGNLANTAMASAAGNAQKPITGNASGATKSAIAAGTVTITDADGQQARTGKTVEETLASLNRDTENANQSIDKIFDAQKIKDEQALQQLTGQTIQQAAPIIYNQVGNALQGQEEYVKVAVHGLVGGLVSRALGGDFGTGAAGVAAATAAIAVLDENLGSLGVDAATKDKLLQLVGTAVAGAVGGNAAAGTAGMADAYNRQLHPEEQDRLKQLQKGKSPEEQQRLADAACALVRCALDVPANDPSYAETVASQERGQQYTAEQSQLKSTGLYQYDTLVDTVRDLQSRSLNSAINEVKSAGQGAKNFADQFMDLLKATNGQTPPSDAGPQVDVTGGNNKTPPSAGAVVTPLPCPVGPGACGMSVTPVLTPGTGLPGNAMASNGDNAGSKNQADDGGPSRAAPQSPIVEPKIAGQMETRGWTQDSIASTMGNPAEKIATQDTRFDPVTGVRRNDPATAYVNADGSYVVVNNKDGTVVQVSNRNDPKWKAPWNK